MWRKLTLMVLAIAVLLETSCTTSPPTYIRPDDVYSIFRAHIYQDLLTRPLTQTWRGKA